MFRADGCHLPAARRELSAAERAAEMLVDTITTGAEEEREAIGELYRMFYARFLEYRMHRTIALSAAVFRAWRVLWEGARAAPAAPRASGLSSGSGGADRD